jgi:hypothetical protein
MADTETTSGSNAVNVKLTETLTEYVILTRFSPADGSAHRWDEAGRQNARSAHDAIRKHGKEGTFVAIPARSWSPIEVAAKKTTTLDLKPAT